VTRVFIRFLSPLPAFLPRFYGPADTLQGIHHTWIHLAMDGFFLLVLIAFAAATYALLALCARLMPPPAPARAGETASHGAAGPATVAQPASGAQQ
jgi:hypothetical protein